MGLFNLFKGNNSKASSEDKYVWNAWLDDDDNEDDDNESLDVYDAADIWLSKGRDEDYMFGYTEEELEDALR